MAKDPATYWMEKQERHRLAQYTPKQQNTNPEDRAREHLEKILQKIADDQAREQYQREALIKAEMEAKKRMEQQMGGMYNYGWDVPPSAAGTMKFGGSTGPSLATEYDAGKDEYLVYAYNKNGTRVRLVPETTVPPQPVTVEGIEAVRMDWLRDGYNRAMISEKTIRVQVEGEGIMIVGMHGDDYHTRLIPWFHFNERSDNPIKTAIEKVEHELDMIDKLKNSGKQRTSA